jgi:predicted dinucleotide-binding enzyme
MDIVVFGRDPRANAVRDLLASGGYSVSSDFDATVPIAVVLAGSHYEYEKIGASGGGASTVVIDATDGRFNRSALEAAGAKVGTQRLVRALLVLPQAGANVLLCADDREAMQLTQQIFEKCGCIPTDRGPLSNADEIQPLDRSLDAEFRTLKSVNTTTD